MVEDFERWLEQKGWEDTPALMRDYLYAGFCAGYLQGTQDMVPNQNTDDES